MRIARRRFLASSIATAGAPALLRLARADTPPITLKLHHAFSAVSGVHDKFLLPWARKVETESSGRLRFDLFPSMQLGGAPAALFDQARDGSADIVWAAPSLTPGPFPKVETFELPFVPSRRALVSSKALTDFAAVQLQDEFREFHVICFSCSDRAAIHANRPVRTIEDIKDLKLHVQTRFAADAMRVLGALPVIMPNAQLPVAIGEHVVDACLDPWHLVPPLRLNDLLRTHTEFSDFSPSARTYVLAMNKASYERLPRELKSVIDSNSGQAAAAMAGVMWDNQAAAVANMVVERGDLIVTLLPEAVARWRKATEPVIDAWRKQVKEQRIDGAKLLLAARILVARYAIEPEPTQPRSPEQQHYSEPTGSQGNATAGFDNKTPSERPPSASTAKPSMRAQPAMQSPQPPLSAHVDTLAPAKLAPPAAGSPSAAPPPVASSTSITGSTTAPAAPSSTTIAPTSPSTAPAPAPPAALKLPPKTLDIPL
jgi:TRAP-type transport system periplasmic protein